MKPNFGVEFTAVNKNQRYKQGIHHQRIMESHIAAYAKEVVRSLTMQYVPSITEFAPNGDQMLRERTPVELEQAVARGIQIAEMTYQRLAEKGWLAEAPPIGDLLETDETSAVGFGSK